jgi:uncharacterized repeat protein (TIGR03803 family)
MIRTKVTRTVALAGFAPAGKLSHLFAGLLPVLALCAATAIALPTQTFTTLHSFDGTDGAYPVAGLVQATNGYLYGTTVGGGANAACDNYYGAPGCGTIFKISTSGTLTTLYNFCSQPNCTDGANPVAGLVQAANGDFYGTAAAGGANNNAAVCGGLETGCGTIFKITPSGTLTTLYSFCAQSECTDGDDPSAGLVQAPNGDFYGTTPSGGANCAPYGCGTVFKITPSGTLTTLYNFCAQGGYPACPDGFGPEGALVQAANGDFYGTTDAGGANCAPYGCGTVFKITPSGTLTTLHSFAGYPTDGGYPAAGLVQATNGDLYGTASGGGANCAQLLGCGTVFKITPSGTLTTIHSFAGSDGQNPLAALIQGTNGELFSTAEYGGAYSNGTVFKITPSGTLTTLYSFCPLGYPCPDSSEPFAGLVQATNGTLYGTTTYGANSYCTSGCGVVFSLSVGLGPFVETQRSYGTVGAVIEILGTDLTGATSVSFNGTAAAFTVVAPSLIAARVPAGATSGTVQVVTPSGTLSSNVPFRVLP